MRSNPPVNTDARASAALCKGQRARAGYWERETPMRAAAISMQRLVRAGCLGAGVLVGHLCYAQGPETLIAPPSATDDARDRYIRGCHRVAAEVSKAVLHVSEHERVPLASRTTGNFIRQSRPVVDRAGNPMEWQSAFNVFTPQNAVSDRYVLCLLANGFRWSKEEQRKEVERLAPSERDSDSLLDAGALYRRIGVNVEAVRLLRLSLQVEEQLSKPDTARVQARLMQLAAALAQQKSYSEGLPLVTRLLPTADSIVGNQRAFLVALLKDYSAELRKTDRAQEAEQIERALADLSK
jgi:hypothetical protein